MPGARAVGRIVALEGPSGVGKSALADALARGVPFVRSLPEAYDRLRRTVPLDVPDAAALLRVERRLARAEAARWRAALRGRARGELVVADTGFVGPLTYALGLARLDPDRYADAPVEALYRGAGPAAGVGWPDLTIFLDAPPRIVARRAAADPAGHPDRWRARHAAVGGAERRLWTGTIAPELGSRWVRIPAGGPAGPTFDRALRAVARAYATPPLGPPAARRLMARVRRRLAVAPATLKKGGRRGGNPRR